MQANVYNIAGEKIREAALPDHVFGVPVHERVLHEVACAYEANRRQNLAHTKDRGDVSGGGKKPWRQKGTGRARHGSIRSPLWVGGGVTFGPRANRNFKKKLNKKVAKKALAMMLSDRATHGAVSLVDSLHKESAKTKHYADFLKTIGLGATRRVLIITPEVSNDVVRCTANLQQVEVKRSVDVNAYDVMRAHAVIVEEPAIEALNKRLA